MNELTLFSVGRYIALPALMFLPNNSLSIMAVEKQAEGWYMCEAENVGGTSSSQVFLKVFIRVQCVMIAGQLFQSSQSMTAIHDKRRQP